MNGEEFDIALKKIGLTVIKAGDTDFFGVSKRNLFKWKSGQAPVPKAASRLIRVMLKYKLTVEDVERLDRSK